MSPLMRQAEAEITGFPRTRGDEPVQAIPQLIAMLFSPHTRG